MQMYLVRASLFSIGLLVGFVVGYVPAVWYFQSAEMSGMNSNPVRPPFIYMSYTTLRGMIREVDTGSRTVTFDAMIPYSPDESTPLRVTFDDATLLLSVPASPELPNLFLPSPDVQAIDVRSLVAGPATVRVTRDPGTLRAIWISVRAPKN